MAFSTTSSQLSTKEEYQEFLATMTAERQQEFNRQSKEAHRLQFYGWCSLCAHKSNTCSELPLATTVLTNPFQHPHRPNLEQEATQGSCSPLVVVGAHWASLVDPEALQARAIVPCPPTVPYMPDLAFLGSVVLTYDPNHVDFELNGLFQGYQLLTKFLFVLLSCVQGTDVHSCLCHSKQYHPPAICSVALCELVWPLEGVLVEPPCSNVALYAKYAQVIDFNRAVVQFWSRAWGPSPNSTLSGVFGAQITSIIGWLLPQIQPWKSWRLGILPSISPIWHCWGTFSWFQSLHFLEVPWVKCRPSWNTTVVKCCINSRVFQLIIHWRGSL